MAPGVTARRLSVPVSKFLMFAALILVSSLVLNVQAMLVYDHQAFYDILNSFSLISCEYGYTSGLPRFWPQYRMNCDAASRCIQHGGPGGDALAVNEAARE